MKNPKEYQYQYQLLERIDRSEYSEFMRNTLGGITTTNYIPSPSRQVVMHCFQELKHACKVSDCRPEWMELFNLLNEIDGNEDCELFFQLGQLCGRLSKPSDEEINEGAQARASRQRGLSKINLPKRYIKEMVKEIATILWRQDTEKKIRTAEMANLVWKALRNVDLLDDFREALPTSVDGIKPWVRKVAPEYAKRGGRPKGKK